MTLFNKFFKNNKIISKKFLLSYLAIQTLKYYCIQETPKLTHDDQINNIIIFAKEKSSILQEIINMIEDKIDYNKLLNILFKTILWILLINSIQYFFPSTKYI